MPTATVNVGIAPIYPPYSNSNSLNAFWHSRAYKFRVVGPRKSINLNLHHISVGDDADLSLYRDDGDGVFDPGGGPFHDRYLTGSFRGSNNDDSVN